MTTKMEVIAAMRKARDAAMDALDAVRAKRAAIAANPLLWPQLSGADGYIANAAMNVATVELLPEVLDDALSSQDQATALGQAMVVIQQTGEATERYARWADASALAQLVRDVWDALVGLVADLAYEVADAVLVVGRKAAEGLGWGALVLGAAAAAAGALLWLRR